MSRLQFVQGATIEAMTIRTYIERRTHLIEGATFAWMIGISIWAAIDPHHARGPGSRLWFFATLGAALAFGGVVWWFTRCPRCGSHFRKSTFSATFKRELFYAASHCPRCHVSIDEPMGE
jgi:hypothetical protein